MYFGEARFAGSDTITVADNVLRFKKALIATGARALISPIPGIKGALHLTNETVFNLSECPRRLLVMAAALWAASWRRRFAASDRTSS